MNSLGGISRVVVEVACFPLSAEKKPRWDFLGGVSWLAIPCFPLSWGKLPRWTYLARNCWNLSS